MPLPSPQPKSPIPSSRPRPFYLDLILTLLNILLLLSVPALLFLGAWDLYFHPLSSQSPAWGKFLLALVLAFVFKKIPV